MDISNIPQDLASKEVEDLIQKHRKGNFLHHRDVSTVIDYTIRLRNELVIARAKEINPRATAEQLIAALKDRP